MYLCQTSGRRRPVITGHFVNTVVHGSALDAISIRAAVVCFPLLLFADWCQHTDCAVPSSLLKPGNTSYPCPASEARVPLLPYTANEIVVGTLFMIPRWRLQQYIDTWCGCVCFLAVCLLPMGLSRARQQHTI